MLWDTYPKYFNQVTPESIEITDEGMKMNFKANELEGKHVRIFYWYKLTALRDIESITNSVKVLGAREIPEVNSKIEIIGGATADGIEGTMGQILLYKQNNSENDLLSGAEFTLTKEGSKYSKIKTSDESGELVFALEKEDNSYKGTYILTETKAPNGYEAGTPITIELNDHGEIVKVNNQSISASGSSGTLVEEDNKKICWVSKDRLALIVYNKISTEETTNITTTKVWEDANNQDGIRPDKVKVQLFANGDKYGDQVELHVDNNWSYTWEKIPKNQGGIEIIYTVEEVEVPKGYTVSYSEDTLTITNEQIPEVDFHFTKIDAADYENPVPLSGAKFTLYKATGEVTDNLLVITDSEGNPRGNWEIVGMYESDDVGLVSVTNLQSGTYQLIETKAPAGYQLPTGQWRFVIDAKNGTISGPIAITSTTAPPALQGNLSTGYLLGNIKSYTLPLTGGNGAYWFAVLGLGCILLAVGLARVKYMCRSK